MKNLKRALSLVLSTAMLLGMMVVGTGASYADVDSNDNVEAIEVLKAAEIMIGDGDDFNPDDKVTREQMAVIMCNILDYNVAQYKGTAPFSDISDWAEPYVAACYTHGIVAGIGNGKFGGQNDVSAAQAALMLMKALGYFQYQADFGDDWQLATVRQGAKAGMYKGIDSSVEEALTRNEIAQMVLNALEADMVYWTGDLGTEITTSDGTEIYIGYTADYKSEIDHDEINYNKGNDHAKTTLQLIESLYGDDFQKLTSGQEDAFGRPATKWTYKLSTVGTFPEEPIATYTAGVNRMTLYNLLGKSVIDDIEADKQSMYVYTDGTTDNRVVVANGNGRDDTRYGELLSASNYAAKNDKTNAAGTGRGVLTEVYLDDDGNVVIVEINTYLVEAAGDYNTIKEELRISWYDSAAQCAGMDPGWNVLSSDDFKGLEDVEDGDFLLITVSDGAVKSVAKAETLTGTVDGYTKTKTGSSFVDGAEITIDGTEYKYSAKCGDQNEQDYAVGEQASLIMDKYGYVIGVAEAMVASNFAYVMDAENVAGLRGGAVEAVLAYTDGTTETVTINKAPDASNGNKLVNATTLVTTSPSNVLDHQWFAYSKTSDGKVNLMPVDGGYNVYGDNTYRASGTMTIFNGEELAAFKTPYNSNATVSSMDRLTNSKTVLMVVDGADDVTVYTGAENLPVILTKNADADENIVIKALAKKANAGYVSFVVVDLGELDGDEVSIIDTNATPDYMFLLDFVREVHAADGVIYYTYETLMADGTIEKVTFDSGSAANQYNLIHKAHYNKDGYVTDSTAVLDDDPYFNNAFASGSETTVSYKDGALTIGGKNYIVTKDTKITLIAEETSNLCKYTGVSYEVNEVSASYLNSALDGLKFEGRIAGNVVAANTNVLETMYIYVVNTVPAP